MTGFVSLVASTCCVVKIALHYAYMKRLYRSKRQKMIAGVFGGLGEYFDVDPTLLRLPAALLLILTGIVPMVIIYILAAIIIPEDPNGSPSA